MTRQELLTKLAMDFKSWESAFGWLAVKADVDEWGACGSLSRQDWQAERDRLINKPSWKDAPEEAKGVAMDGDGVWFFYSSPSMLLVVFGGVGDGIEEGQFAARVGNSWQATKAIAIPAGYDWTESLENRPQ